MELSRVEKFKALNSKDIPNVKDCEGQVLKPVAFYTHEYEDSESKSHYVLVIKDGKTGLAGGDDICDVALDIPPCGHCHWGSFDVFFALVGGSFV